MHPRLAHTAPSPLLVDLLLLVNAELARTAVDKEQETTNDGQDLEEVVLGKVLVGVVLVELSKELAFAQKRLGILGNLTVQKLLTKRLKMLRSTTRRVALNLALKPTTTMTQAPAPKMLTITRQMDQLPLKMNPRKRKIRRTRPASWKYIFLSFSSS